MALLAPENHTGCCADCRSLQQGVVPVMFFVACIGFVLIAVGLFVNRLGADLAACRAESTRAKAEAQHQADDATAFLRSCVERCSPERPGGDRQAADRPGGEVSR